MQFACNRSVTVPACLQFFQYGGNSMLLTVVNIVVIIAVGTFMLRAQEFGPRSSSFWKQDVGLARKLRSTSVFRQLGQKLKATFHDTGVHPEDSAFDSAACCMWLCGLPAVPTRRSCGARQSVNLPASAGVWHSVISSRCSLKDVHISTL